MSARAGWAGAVTHGSVPLARLGRTSRVARRRISRTRQEGAEPDLSERGAITIFVTVAVIGLLAMAGLVVDGGAKVRAAQRADRVAAEAARAAGQEVDLAGLLAGERVTVDRRTAVARARDYLDRADVDGSVEILDGGATLRVRTTTSEETVFLGLLGMPRLSVSGQAEVRLTTQREGPR